MYKEGGTMIYFYDTYTIIKGHSLNGDRDVYKRQVYRHTRNEIK